MDHFEYLYAFVSIIVGLSVAQVLQAAGSWWDADTLHWPHTGWVILVLLLAVQIWWACWDLRSVNWTQFLFYWEIFGIVVLFMLATLVVPTGGSGGRSWAAHLEYRHTAIYVTGLVYLVWATLNSYILLGLPLLHPYRVSQGTLLLITVAGLRSVPGRFRDSVSWLLLGTLLGFQAIFRMLPQLG